MIIVQHSHHYTTLLICLTCVGCCQSLPIQLCPFGLEVALVLLFSPMLPLFPRVNLQSPLSIPRTVQGALRCRFSTAVRECVLAALGGKKKENTPQLFFGDSSFVIFTPLLQVWPKTSSLFPPGRFFESTGDRSRAGNLQQNPTRQG